MTREELEATYITNEHGMFTPIYSENEGVYTIIKTSEEVYQDYLNPPAPQKTELEILKETVEALVLANLGV